MRIAGVVLVGLLVPGVAFAQSLGEIARKDKERREQQAKEPKTEAVKTFTDEDLAKKPDGETEGEAVVSFPGGGGSSPSTTSASARGREPGLQIDDSRRQSQQQAQWRGRMAAAEAKLERARARLDKVLEQYKHRDEQSRSNAASFPRKEIEAAEREIERIQDEARTQDIPAGWLR